MSDAESPAGMNVMSHSSIRPRTWSICVLLLEGLHVRPLTVLWAFYCTNNLSVL